MVREHSPHKVFDDTYHRKTVSFGGGKLSIMRMDEPKENIVAFKFEFSGEKYGRYYSIRRQDNLTEIEIEKFLVSAADDMYSNLMRDQRDVDAA